MQQPIRYYITKSGDEPTVRSVKVARGEREVDFRADTPAVKEQAARAADAGGSRPGVTRLMRQAIRRRGSDA
ncbi:MAG: hypothetical protein IT338_05635 [Thermomicrobiales bacterium]|nr:hypothetical protein [Thermomicrobiales bacterium]